MSYADLVMLLPDWAWLLLAGACVLTALFAFLWMLPSLQWSWLIQDDPYEAPDTFPADWRGDEWAVEWDFPAAPYDQDRDAA